jgi:Ca2+-binding RTX toxin-like protein
MTNFIETIENDVELSAINELPFVALPTLAPGDTVTGTIGAEGDTADTLSLHVVAGLSYNFSYSINGSDDITVVFPTYGIFELNDGVSSVTFFGSPEETTGTVDISILRDLETNAVPNNYTFSFEVAVPFAPSQDDDIGVGTSEADTIRLINGDDLYYAYAGDDRVDGGNGDDEIYGGDGNDDVRGDAGNDELFGGIGDDYANGGRGNDLIDQGDGDDRARGNDDDDEIYGGAGEDRIYGDAGNDYLDGGDDADVMLGGNGDDEMYGGGARDVMLGQNGIDYMYGGEGNDVMNGGNQNDVMFGGAGFDRMVGGVGNDQMFGGEGNDRVFGFRGEDTMILGGGNDTARGGDDADVISGGEGNDRIYGDGGDDRLTGGSGRDHMFGGEGSDIFVFEFGDFRTVVRDFDATEDQIDITDFAFLLPDDFGSDFLIPDVGDALNLPFWVNPDAVRETNGNLVFNFGTGDVLTLSNTTLADLSVDNFVLPDDFFVPDVLG